MNKHERRAYDAGAQARELDIPLDANPFDADGHLGLWNAWGSGWNDADEAVKEAAAPVSTPYPDSWPRGYWPGRLA